MAKIKSALVEYNRIEQQVWTLAQPLVASCGAELIDVEYVREAGQWYMRLYIDREPPVDLDLCEQVSNLVSPALDKNDPVSESYFLEVSSPGLERSLRRAEDLMRYVGQPVTVKLYAPPEGSKDKEFHGELIGRMGDDVLVDIAGETRAFPLDQVAKLHLRADI